VLALVRGDDRLSEEKLTTVFEASFRPATEDEIRATFGSGGGSIGPVGVDVEVIADESLRDGQFVAGANRDGWHLRGVEAGRDYQPTFADLRQARAGDSCPQCGGRLIVQAAIELGHIFKLGTFHSDALGANYVDEDGVERPIVMGSYGIGPGRTIAAIIEQHHDERGIVWPASVAPYDVHVVALPGLEEQAERAAHVLAEAGRDVLLDDRDARAGEKFADADLIGCPQRVTVGRRTHEDDAVDVRDRATGDEQRVPIDELVGAPV
jgi:prolyl-tRNA synthetase